jgi:hypothetical protein
MCQDSIAKPAGTLVPGATFTSTPQLHVDVDKDRVTDYIRAFVNLRPGEPNASAKVSLLPPGSIVRVDWEDQFPDDGSGVTADYNDYAALLEMRDCQPHDFRTDALAAQSVCLNACGDPCPWTNNDERRFAVTAAVIVDKVRTENVRYESTGRKLSISVAVHTDFRPGDLGGKPMRIGICPQVEFFWKAGQSNFNGTYSVYDYAPSSCDLVSSYQPSCYSNPMTPPTELPVALSNMFNARVSCGATAPTGADTEIVRENMACGPIVIVKNYEILMRDFDALAGRGNGFGTDEAPEVEQLISAFRVRIFTDLPLAGSGFACPTGIGASLGHVGFGPHAVQSYDFVNGPTGFPAGFAVLGREQ